MNIKRINIWNLSVIMIFVLCVFYAPDTFALELGPVSAQTHSMPDIYMSDSFSVDGTAEPGLQASSNMVQYAALRQPVTITRVVSPAILKWHIELVYRMGWIDSEGVMKSLFKKAEAVEASIAREQNKTAKNQLNAFMNELNAQHGKHLNDNAMSMLSRDVQFLLYYLR